MGGIWIKNKDSTCAVNVRVMCGVQNAVNFLTPIELLYVHCTVE
jgi:hypothetical protein